MPLKIIKVPWIPGDADALTLPPIGIFVENEDAENKALLAHERGHEAQYEEWGFFKFYGVILWQYLIHGPIKAPVEADATKRGQE